MPKSIFTGAYASMRAILIASRRDAKVSQIELAARLGKTQSFVSQIERGVRRLDVIEFIAIARAIGLDPCELLARVAEKVPAKVDI